MERAAVNLFENGLAKLKITGYSDREMSRKTGELTAMYNPSTIALDYRTDYRIDEFINSTKQSNRYRKARPGGLTIELIFDASLPGNDEAVDDQLASLRALCCEVDPGTGEPYFLRISWGKLQWNGLGYFAGRMATLNVRYVLFDRDGTPLRAQASLGVTADESLVLQDSQNGLKAPDDIVLPVPDMSTLPLLAALGALTATLAVGGTDYLGLAYINNLASLSDLAPGQPLRYAEDEGTS